MTYSAEVARSAAESLKKLEANAYSIVLVSSTLADDKDGWKKIIGKMNGQKPYLRRQIFVVLVSDTLKSGDSSAAFFNGVNLTANKSDLGNLADLIQEGQKHFREFYSLFNKMSAEKSLRF
jgi:hypothetical protein